VLKDCPHHRHSVLGRAGGPDAVSDPRIHVDGASEFISGFRTAGMVRGTVLYVLPPRSPKLNGRVDRLYCTARHSRPAK
jgi:hypothetical protein